jgi:hypothetical protein
VTREPVDSAAPSERAGLEELAQRGEHAATAFVQANLRLVVSLARRYSGSDAALMDRIQDGNLGLMHAVEKFPPQRRTDPPDRTASPPQAGQPTGPAGCSKTDSRPATCTMVSAQPPAAGYPAAGRGTAQAGGSTGDLDRDGNERDRRASGGRKALADPVNQGLDHRPCGAGETAEAERTEPAHTPQGADPELDPGGRPR